VQIPNRPHTIRSCTSTSATSDTTPGGNSSTTPAGPRRIQIEEGTYHHREHWPARVTRQGLYAGFGFAIGGGSLPWLYQAWLAKDWVSFGAILVCAILVFFAVTKVWMRKLQRQWSAAVLMVCVLTAMTLTAVNLRWTAWMYAYRQSAAYDPRGDVSLTTINLILIGLFVALFGPLRDTIRPAQSGE